MWQRSSIRLSTSYTASHSEDLSINIHLREKLISHYARSDTPSVRKHILWSNVHVQLPEHIYIFRHFITADGQTHWMFLISNFRLVLNVLCFLLGTSPASEFCMPTFRNTVCSIFIGLWRWNRQSVPKCWHIKFRRKGITQKKAYNIDC